MTPHSFTNLGARPRPKDKRDFKLGAAALPGAYPAVYMQENAWNAPILYQGQQPACGAHGAAALNYILNSYGGTTTAYSPRFTWIDIKQHDGFPLESGTDMRSIFKSLQETGTLPLAKLPNDGVNSMSLEQYADKKAVSQEMRDTAKQNLDTHYAFKDAPTFEQLKQLIYENRAVALLIQLSERFWTAENGKTSWAESDILPLAHPSTKWPVVSAHFVVAHSYDENYIYFQNSFSDVWGRKGHGYFGTDYMPWVLEAGTVATAAPWVADNLKQQISLAQLVIQKFQQLISRRKSGVDK